MGFLRDYLEIYSGRLIHKWLHYFEVYERDFERVRGKPVNVLEFGVSHGGSLQMKAYFGPKARIYGVDTDPRCKGVDEGRIEVRIGDQADRDFLRSLRAELPRIDVLMDDGGHTMAQQIATLEEMFPHVADNGVYVCEDVHTSYWSRFGGGLRLPGSFVEHCKPLIDQLNAWHSESPTWGPDEFTRSAHAMHFHDSVVVIEKCPALEPPRKRRTGKSSF